VDFVRPVTPTQEELISLLHRYPEAAAAACAERMRRPHNLQSSTVGQPHPFIGQFNSPQRPGDPRCGRCTHGQHVRLDTTLPLPSPEPPASPRLTPPPPATTPPQPQPRPPPRFSTPPPPRSVRAPALRSIAGYEGQIRMLPGPTPAVSRRARARQTAAAATTGTRSNVCRAINALQHCCYKIPARHGQPTRGCTVLRRSSLLCPRRFSAATASSTCGAGGRGCPRSQYCPLAASASNLRCLPPRPAGL
jgi:hypothetical protein